MMENLEELTAAIDAGDVLVATSGGRLWKASGASIRFINWVDHSRRDGAYLVIESAIDEGEVSMDEKDALEGVLIKTMRDYGAVVAKREKDLAACRVSKRAGSELFPPKMLDGLEREIERLSAGKLRELEEDACALLR